MSVQVEVGFFAEGDGPLAMPGAATVSGAAIVDCTALRCVMRGHSTVCSSAKDLIFIISINVIPNLSAFQYLDLLHRSD